MTATSASSRRRTIRCGTEASYQRHRNLGEVTCQPCCDAHAIYRVLERGTRTARAVLAESVEHPRQYAAALAGREVAEALTPSDRAWLVRELHGLGWTDVQIATHTRMTTFTTAEIRARIGLAPNQAHDHARHVA